MYAFQAYAEQVRFSLRGGCEQAIVKELNKDRSEIPIQAYSFTPAPIAKR